MNAEKLSTKSVLRQAKWLNHKFRKIVHPPQEIVKKYIAANSRVLDMGCGPGYFTNEFAAMLNENGVVIASDIRQEMLDIVKSRILETPYGNRVEYLLVKDNKFELQKPVNLVFAFFVIHQVPDRIHFIDHAYKALDSKGLFYVSVPKIMVSKKEFEKIVKNIIDGGFVIVDRPKVFFGRAVVARKEGQ